MSGLPTTLSPIDLRHKEAEYRALLSFCDINEEDPERLKRLRDGPAEKLLRASWQWECRCFIVIKTRFSGREASLIIYGE
jgi:hypothetical protein